jgi:hypothetical protein
VVKVVAAWAQALHMLACPSSRTLKYKQASKGTDTFKHWEGIHRLGKAAWETEGKGNLKAMIRENRQLVTNEPVEFER